MKVKKGDTVVVMEGEYRGKTGKVLKVFHRKGTLIVEGVNFLKRHTKPTQTRQQGGILTKEGPINASNVMVYCSNCARGVKVAIRALPDGSKGRYCRRCGELLG